MKFKWTLYRKIQIIIVVVLILVFAASQIIVSNLLGDSLKNSFESNVSSTSLMLQKNIEVVFNDASNSLFFLHNQYSGGIRDDIYIRDYLKVLNETKDYVINSYVAYDDGTFVLEPYVKISDTFDPRTRDWYKDAYNTRNLKWSLPYLDEVTNELVITGSLYLPLLDFDSVVGVDIRLNSLPEIIKTSALGENGFILLVDREGLIITDSNGVYNQQNIAELKDDEFVNSNLISGSIQTKKGFYYLRRLKKTNMNLIAFLPSEDLDLAKRQVQLVSSMVLLVALFVGILISYILAKRITKPIEALTHTMLDSLNQDSLLLYDGKTNDEIDTLISGYNTIAKSVNDQKKALKLISNDLLKSEKKLQEQYDKVADLAYYDHLTNLPNRLSFEQQTKLMINDQSPFALFYLDLDNFKYINDSYGHNYGDFVLQIISARFKTSNNGRYFGARLSGDEFGLIVTYEAEKELTSVAEAILKIVSEPIQYNDLEFTLTASLGISLYPEDGRTFEDLLANSDIAMYEAKAKSKNQFMIFDKELRNKLINRVKIETNLFNALDNNEIYVCYQPLIDFQTKKVQGFEALVRWESETLGMIYPDEFIPIAEHNLFINQLGYFVLRESIKFGQKLKEIYGVYFEMNVNVSLIQLHLEQFVLDVKNLIDEFNFPAEYLNLEITESVALESDKKIQQKLNALRAFGIGLSLDDFGTGYSSLNHLLIIQLSHLKIDRSIILNATKEKEVYQLVQGIVEFAHAIGLKVVAEGIEDTLMEDMMARMHIDYAQGYLYSRPVREDKIIEYLLKHIQ